MESTRHTFEEIKEYSDSATQYDPTLFAVNHGMQTEPERKIVTATFSTQTDPIPEPKALPTPPPRITVEMEIQTEDVEAEPSRSPFSRTRRKSRILFVDNRTTDSQGTHKAARASRRTPCVQPGHRGGRRGARVARCGGHAQEVASRARSSLYTCPRWRV